MEKAGTDFIERLAEERHRYLEDFAKCNDDLHERLKAIGLSATVDLDDDALILTVGEPQETVSFTADGDLFLRTDLVTNKLVGAELYYFSEHAQKRSLPFRIMLNFLQIAGSSKLVLLPQPAKSVAPELAENIRRLADIARPS